MFSMACSNSFTFVIFLLFGTLLQEIILVNAEKKCSSPTFGSNQKVVLEYFFNSEHQGLGDAICNISLKSDGLISLVYRMSRDIKNKDTCKRNSKCVEDRMFACEYKNFQDIYNDCSKKLPLNPPIISNDCVCEGSADYILTDNEARWKKYGVPNLPALVLNAKYDLCWTDYSFDGIKAHLCKAYNNAISLCKN